MISEKRFEVKIHLLSNKKGIFDNMFNIFIAFGSENYLNKLCDKLNEYYKKGLSVNSMFYAILNEIIKDNNDDSFVDWINKSIKEDIYI